MSTTNLLALKNYSKESIGAPDRLFSREFSITSETGTGKSTTIRLLQEHFRGYPMRFVSGGSIMTMFAEERGMTKEQMANHNRLHPEDGYDHKCDTEIAHYALQNQTILEGRLVHLFAPRAFHILLYCKLAIRADRRFKKQNPEGLICEVIEGRIRQRDRDDHVRYEKLYPGYNWGKSDYHVAINTGKHNEKEVVSIILNSHKAWLSSLNEEKIIRGVII